MASDNRVGVLSARELFRLSEDDMIALRFFTFLLLACAAGAVAAQDFTAYTASVTGDSVRLRSGPSLAHPPIHVMAEGDKLTVVAEQDGWAVVRLPSSAPCWLAAEFVQAAGGTWIVTGDKVNLRASADTRYFPVGQAGKDQVLTAVMGEDGKPIVENEFVRVVPPAQATGAVNLDFVKRTSDAVVESADSAPETKPEAKPAEEPAKPLVRRSSIKRDATPEELEDERKTFAELERLLDDELKKPAADISLTAIRGMFEQFEELAVSEKIRDDAAGYIRKIDATVRLIDAEKARLDKIAAERAEEINRIRAEAQKIGKEQPKEEVDTGPVEYVAIGTVGSHGQSARTPASHRLFDDKGKVVLDLRWDKGDLTRFMGSRVGIVGEIKEYDGWPHSVIVITRIDVIDEGEDK